MIYQLKNGDDAAFMFSCEKDVPDLKKLETINVNLSSLLFKR